MAPLPTGTLTFLFTDIEGSTRLVQALGRRWDAVLEDHHRILRAAIVDHDGTEIGTEGDSFFAVFGSADRAVAAAVAAQRSLASHPWPDGASVRVRIGLHTGTATLAGGSYTGLDVHRAARIMSAGHGGQVLLSDVTRLLVGAALPAGVTVRDLGEHRLKDLGAPERLHELVVEGLPDEYPRLRTLDVVATNLPVELTTFLGRERDVAAVTDLLGRARLVTLTGPGGSGKTRLALHAAGNVTDRFPDGVWFVPLASIREPVLVASAVAQVLEIADRDEPSLLEQLVERLRTQHLLLVLDNFEHVTDAAPIITGVLSGAPAVRVLVTSRAVLHLTGEHEYPVPPLDVPDLDHLPAIESLAEYGSIALFVERASAARPGFSLTPGNATAVAQVCAGLDGLPLAIELAAARVKLLPPEAIVERLGDRLGLLASGPRDVPERQRTLRGAIEWSHDLLEAEEQRMFACFSVFLGGAGLDALQPICAGIVDGDVLGAVSSLADKSLVRYAEGVAARPRFGMLETIREFALERSLASGLHAELQRRHAEWYADFAEQLSARIMGPDQRTTLDRLEEEHPNLRVALAWAMDADRPDVALRLVSRLWRMWQMRLHINEGLGRARLAVAMPRSIEFPELRADALEAAGGLAYWAGDVEETRQWYEQALEARRKLGDDAAVAEALYNLSFAFSYVKPDVPAEDLDMTRRLGAEAMQIFRALGNASGEARTLWMLASVDAAIGDFAAMEEKSTRAEDVFRRLGDRYYLAWALWSTAFARLGMGDVDRARGPVREALELFAAAKDLSGAVTMLELAALIAIRSGDVSRAALLSGAVVHAEEESGLDVNLFPRAILSFDPHELQTRPESASAWNDGAAMELQAVFAFATAGLQGDSE